MAHELKREKLLPESGPVGPSGGPIDINERARACVCVSVCLSVCLSNNLSLPPWQHEASVVRKTFRTTGPSSVTTVCLSVCLSTGFLPVTKPVASWLGDLAGMTMQSHGTGASSHGGLLSDSQV